MISLANFDHDGRRSLLYPNVAALFGSWPAARDTGRSLDRLGTDATGNTGRVTLVERLQKV